MFFRSFRIKRRVLKTLERFKFKVQNPESKVFGHFKQIRKYNSEEFVCYEVGKFKFHEFKMEDKIVFYYDSRPQIVLRGGKVTLFSEYQYLNKLLDQSDDMTNNDTR